MNFLIGSTYMWISASDAPRPAAPKKYAGWTIASAEAPNARGEAAAATPNAHAERLARYAHTSSVSAGVTLQSQYRPGYDGSPGRTCGDDDGEGGSEEEEEEEEARHERRGRARGRANGAVERRAGAARPRARGARRAWTRGARTANIARGDERDGRDATI
jgi:hypothetical protein